MPDLSMMGINNLMEAPLQTSQLIKTLLFVATGIALAACAPTAQQVKDAIEKDPSIVFVAIEKDPAKFIEVVNKAAQDAQKVAGDRAEQEEKKAREEEFKNPLKPELQEGRVIFGNKNAKVTIFEYSDFQCPYCTRGYQTMDQVKKEYGDKVRIVFKHLPLDFHPLAMPAAKYFEAIAKQSHEKAEKFHDMMFQNQGQMKDKGEKLFVEFAKKLGVDMKKLNEDLKDPAIEARIAADMDEARKFNISGTPGFIINGVSLRGAYPFPDFKEIIDQHLKQ
jgi:protein-disulfide isomerase